MCGAAGLAKTGGRGAARGWRRSRATALGGPEALSGSERRVAALAAGGRTNREIAQELFVTPKTVEVHLTNVYRKLGIRSRRELPEDLGGLLTDRAGLAWEPPGGSGRKFGGSGLGGLPDAR